MALFACVTKFAVSSGEVYTSIGTGWYNLRCTVLLWCSEMNAGLFSPGLMVGVPARYVSTLSPERHILYSLPRWFLNLLIKIHHPRGLPSTRPLLQSRRLARY
jgi:hypothetical protein